MLALCRLLMISTLLVFVLATAAMLQHQEPFFTWYYSFAWWSYIIFVESFLHVHGYQALLFAHPTRFLLRLPLSITFWLIFEVFNFRLQNWHYLELPASTALRWLGYLTAFATVLPALFTTRDLLEHLGLFRNLRTTPVRLPHGGLSLLPIGMTMLLLPILLPTLCFPLIWLGFIFLCEPVTYRYGVDSVLRDLEQGKPRNPCLLLASGFLCGILWECFNFWAGSKWIYTIPYLGFLKIFEMPILGFLGFPPFAVESYVLVSAFFLLHGRIRRNPSPRSRVASWIILGVAVLSFNILAFLGIDAFTVVSFGTEK